MAEFADYVTLAEHVLRTVTNPDLNTTNHYKLGSEKLRHAGVKLKEVQFKSKIVASTIFF